MIKILIILSVVFIASCGDYETNVAISVGGSTFTIVCIDGVEYVTLSKVYSGYMSPHYKTDGSLYLCGGAE